MKKLIIIYMLLGISIISFGQREFNPYAISIDTVKYKNEIKTNGTSVHYMSKYKDGSFSRDEVEDFYFYPEGMSFERKDDFMSLKIGNLTVIELKIMQHLIK